MKIMKTSLILFMLFFATISAAQGRSEEHTSELQSQSNLVCRLLLEKKKKHKHSTATRQPSRSAARHRSLPVQLCRRLRLLRPSPPPIVRTHRTGQTSTCTTTYAHTS